MTDKPLTVARMADLRAAFTNVDLPFQRRRTQSRIPPRACPHRRTEPALPGSPPRPCVGTRKAGIMHVRTRREARR